MDSGRTTFRRVVLVISENRARAFVRVGRYFGASWDVRYARSADELEQVRQFAPWLELAVVHVIDRVHSVKADVDRFRRIVPKCRVVVAAERCTAATVNGALRARAECVVLVNADTDMHWFASSGADEAAMRMTFLRATSSRYGLTPRQCEVLALGLRAHTYAQMSAVLGVSHNTVKTHVQGLLRRCDAPSLSAVVERCRL